MGKAGEEKKKGGAEISAEDVNELNSREQKSIFRAVCSVLSLLCHFL